MDAEDVGNAGLLKSSDQCSHGKQTLIEEHDPEWRNLWDEIVK
ncbi:hypothetical protein [Devosia salina]|nr:hypothetical protein [Devosia salina]